jgi:hypothetical protein
VTEAMTTAQILNKTLRLEGESLGDFVKQIKGLTDDDKKELAELGAKLLGVELKA